MGIYRQSIWKGDAVQTLFLTQVCMLALACIGYIIDLGILNSFQILVMALGILLFMGLSVATSLFYVVITSKELQLGNAIYRFWHSEFRFSEIEKVVLGHEGGYSPYYMQIFYSGKKSWRYVIDLVNRKQYKDLIAELEAKGVNVELKNVKIK